MSLIVWMEAVQSSGHLTQEADQALSRIRESYGEQVRRMTSPPITGAQKLTLSESREFLLLALIDDLECSSPSGAVNVLVDAKMCKSIGNLEPTAEEINAMLVESLCRILKNRREFENCTVKTLVLRTMQR